MNILKKAYNDLLIHPGRTALVIFALFIGLWGFGTILTSYTILKNDLTENYMRTNPAHIIITSNNFELLDLKNFRQRPEIESAEFRDLSFLRIEAYPDKWLPLWLYGVEDFDHFNLARFYTKAEITTPPPGTIFIERDAQNTLVSNLKKSSLARIRAGSKIKNIPVSGIVFDPAQPPSTQDAIIFAYTDKNTYSEITQEQPSQRLILRINNATSVEQVKETAQKIRDTFNAAGITIKSVEIPPFNEHPHQFQLNTLLMINGLIGLLAFIMGAVLVSQLMDAILSQQIRQIGILKTIGASRFQVMKIYLFMILILGFISSVIAIPLAILTGYAYAGFVAYIINFEILTVSLPAYIYWFLIAAGLFMPVLFSFSAIWKGANLTVYDALVDYGLSSKIETGKKEFVSRGALFFLSNRAVLAFRNTLRRKKLLMITIATMILGVAIFNTGFNVRQALVVFLDNNRDSMKYDVQVDLKKQLPTTEVLLSFQSLDNLSRIETWSGSRGQLLTDAISPTNNIPIVALPYDTSLLKWEVMQGRWLNRTENLETNKNIEIVLNQSAETPLISIQSE